MKSCLFCRGYLWVGRRPEGDDYGEGSSTLGLRLVFKNTGKGFLCACESSVCYPVRI